MSLASVVFTIFFTISILCDLSFTHVSISLSGSQVNLGLWLWFKGFIHWWGLHSHLIDVATSCWCCLGFLRIPWKVDLFECTTTGWVWIWSNIQISLRSAYWIRISMQIQPTAQFWCFPITRLGECEMALNRLNCVWSLIWNHYDKLMLMTMLTPWFHFPRTEDLKELSLGLILLHT